MADNFSEILLDFFTLSSVFGVVVGIAGVDLRGSGFFFVSVGSTEVDDFSLASVWLVVVGLASAAAFFAARTSSLFQGNIDGVEFDFSMILPFD